MTTRTEVRVMNLTNGGELYFDLGTDPRYAVAYAWCEEQGPAMFDRLMEAVHERDGFEALAPSLPLVEGEKTWACGDWAALKR